MTAEFIAVDGTGGLNRRNSWTAPTSPFSTYAMARGLVNVANRAYPFFWSTDLNFGSSQRNDWRAGGASLFFYVTAPARPDLRLAGYETNVIAFSHGGQVALYAASYGMKINCLVTVGTPIVKGMDDVIDDARPNITRWLHLHSKRDWIQILGALFDGRLGCFRKFKQADRNDTMPKGHGDILRDPELFHEWVDKGWFDFVLEGK